MATKDSASGSFFRKAPSTDRITRQRWIICGLLFLATVIAYIDRGVIAYLEKFLEGVIPGLDSVKYGYILAAFQTAYAIGMVVAGGLTDKLGTRKAFAIAIGLWSVAAMLPGAAFSVLTFGIAMFLLGLGEAANFPACIKTVAEWFPKRERALATGIFNSGANIGNIAVPLIVPALVALVSWRGAFVITGAVGIVWLIFWLIYYRRPDQHWSVSKGELALILSDPVENLDTVSWTRVVWRKETWAFAIGKFLTDPIWWFYLFWLPRYLQLTFGLSLASNRLPLVAVYSISTVGSIGGGWISSSMIKAGKSANVSRKTAMLICALCVMPVFAGAVSSPPLDGGGTCGHGHCRASGLVRQHIHAAIRYVSEGGCRQRHRHRRNGGSHRRSLIAACDRLRGEDYQQLRAAIRHRVRRISAGAHHNSLHYAQTGDCTN